MLDVKDILLSLLLIYFAPFSCVCIVDFKQVNVFWDYGIFNTFNVSRRSNNW